MQTLRLIAAFALFVTCIPVGATGSIDAKYSSDAAVEARCRPFFHDACSEAMGRWLPSFGFRDPWSERAKHIEKRDDFAYRAGRASSEAFLSSHGPVDGTFFVYGNAGPPKGHALYDRAHRIVFYEQGCCSWNDMVVAADTPAPPKFVKARDLRDLSTVRGIRLGQTEHAVTTIYGKTASRPVPGHPGVDLLAYTTWPTKPIALSQVPNAPGQTRCGQTQEFFFRKNRLILIRIADGC